MSKSSGYGYARSKQNDTDEIVTFGPDLPFEAAEAYKLLRTNIYFSLSGDRGKIIGVVSSTRHEGKTTTSVNLAYALAEAGKTVLLIDCDMRLPRIATHFKLPVQPGLSDVLAGMTSGNMPIQKSGMLDRLFIMTSGQIPPNPSELLGTENCKTIFERLKDAFDYIIVDLPPIGIVADALMLSKICDGFVFVVRNRYVGKREVADSVSQLSYTGAKVLGFVLSYADADPQRYGKRYGKKKGYYYSSYYSKGYGYGYGYGHSSKHHKSETTEEKQSDDKNDTANQADQTAE